MIIDQQIKDSKAVIPEADEKLKELLYQKIKDIDSVKRKKKWILCLPYRFFFAASLLIVSIIACLLMAKTDKTYERIDDDGTLCNYVFTSKSYETLDLSTSGGMYNFFGPGYQFFLVEVKDTEEYVCGYIRNEVKSFLKEWRDEGYVRDEINKLSLYQMEEGEVTLPYFDYENGITGEYLSYFRWYFSEDLPKTYEFLIKGTDRVKSCLIQEDDVRWYTFKSFEEIVTEIDGYQIDLVLQKRDLIIKENLGTKETLLMPTQTYIQKLSGMENNRIINVLPKVDDQIWNHIIFEEVPGEYVKFVLKDRMVEAIKDNPYQYKLKKENGITLFSYPRTKVVESFNDMFGYYAYYFSEIEVVTQDYHNIYLDYDKMANILYQILNNSLQKTNIKVCPWPSEVFFNGFGLEMIEKPKDPRFKFVFPGICLQIENQDLDYFYSITRDMYDQGFTFSGNKTYNYEQLVQFFNNTYIFQAIKKTEEKDFPVSVEMKDSIIKIRFD